MAFYERGVDIPLDRIHALQKMDPSVWEEEYPIIYKALEGYINSKMGGYSKAAREDVVLEAIRRIVDGLPFYEYTGVPLESWMFTVANNLVKNTSRKSSVQREKFTFDESGPDGDLISDTTSKSVDDEVEERIDKELQLIAMMQSLHSLLPQEQRVLMSQYLLEMSNDAIAQNMGKSVGAVKAIRDRAIKKIRKRLKPTSEGEW